MTTPSKASQRMVPVEQPEPDGSIPVEGLAAVLRDHDADRMECMDHEGLCCPDGDAHDFDSAYEHQAEAALAWLTGGGDR